MSNYVVYRIDCVPTGEFYHGHSAVKGFKYYAWQARESLAELVLEHGWDNFKKVAISYHETKKEAKEAEALLIDCDHPLSINLDPGNDKRGTGTKKKISNSKAIKGESIFKGSCNKKDEQVFRRYTKRACLFRKEAVLSVNNTRSRSMKRLTAYLKHHMLPLKKADWTQEHYAKAKGLLADGYERV